MAKLDITGQRFGRLVATGPDTTAKRTHWHCKCDCGAITVVALQHLRGGATKSCGCLNRDVARARHLTHGKSNHARAALTNRLYTIWNSMKKRCCCKTDKAYPRYGGRGIALCPEWHDFPEFEEWAISNGYADDLSIDRIDNDSGYEPSNCRWADRKTQARNTSASRLIAYSDKTATLAEHAEDALQPYARVRSRIQRGWSVEEALTTPRYRRMT